MLRRTIIAAALTMALPLACGSATGQDIGGPIQGGQYYTSQSYGYAGGGFSGCGTEGFGGYNGPYAGYYSPNCGRGISNSQAAALWAGYCSEDCSFAGGGGCGRGCGLFRGCRGRGHGCGCGLLRGLFRCGHRRGGCCGIANGGCNSGFDSAYSIGSGCGCGSGYNGGCGCRLFHRCRGAGCLARLFSRHRGGCGCYQGCFGYPRGIGSAIGGCGCDGGFASSGCGCDGGYVSAGCGTDGGFASAGCGCDGAMSYGGFSDNGYGYGGGCGSGCFGRGHGCGCCLLRKVGRGACAVVRGAVKLPCCIVRKLTSGCCSRRLGRCGCTGYDGGYFYDSPAANNSFSFYSGGISNSCGCDGGSVGSYVPATGCDGATASGPVPAPNVGGGQMYGSPVAQPQSHQPCASGTGCSGQQPANYGVQPVVPMQNGVTPMNSFSPGGDVIQGQLQGNGG